MEIKELKSRITIIEVADRLGIHVNKYGKALCPFHDDKNPSLQFSKEKNIATCFSGNCTAGTMDQIKLVEKKLNLSTHEAIIKLQEWITPGGGQVGEPTKTNGQQNNGEALSAVALAKEGLSKTAVLTKAFHYYENSLKTAAKAKEYLASRGYSTNLSSIQNSAL